jgi:hypothetical protein
VVGEVGEPGAEPQIQTAALRAYLQPVALHIQCLELWVGAQKLPALHGGLRQRPFRTSAKAPYVKSRLTGKAAASNVVIVASWRTRANISQWVTLVNNIPSLAPRLNGLNRGQAARRLGL